MANAEHSYEDCNGTIVLDLLDLVASNGEQSQRMLAEKLGIAVGLVNTYLKRCVHKGLVKIRGAPARRYAYYLTSKGLAEKSRLTVSYLTFSLRFFRQAKTDCVALFDVAARSGFKRIALLGQSDLAEIVLICSIGSEIEIVVVVEGSSLLERFVGVPVVKTLDTDIPFDAVIVTDLNDATGVASRAIAHLGCHRVLVPGILRVNPLVRRSMK